MYINLIYFIKCSSDLLPGDARYRSANRTGHENNRFSFFHVRSRESFYEFWRDHLLLLDHVQIALKRGFASLVPCDAGHHAGVRSAHVRDHQRVVTRLVHEDLVGQIVGHLLAVYVPCHLGVRAARYATIKPENHVYIIVSFVHPLGGKKWKRKNVEMLQRMNLFVIYNWLLFW